MDPATVWRGPGYEGPDPPEPWPGRHEAFLTACALHAGRRERDLMEIMEGLAEGASDAATAPKVPHPMRR